MNNDDYTDVRNTLIVALGFWAGAVAAGMRSDVFARLPAEVIVALAAFAGAFAIAAVTVDARLRTWLDDRGGHVARLAILGTVVMLLAAGTQIAGAQGPRLAAAPWAAMLLFGVPVTAALAVAASGAAWRGKIAALRRPASTAPAPRPAAT